MTDVLMRKVRFFAFLVQSGRIREVATIIRRKVWSLDEAYGLRRDLTVAFPAPPAAIDFTVREATDDDVARLTNLDEPGLAQDELHERRDRKIKYTLGVQATYVGVTGDGAICYFQWVVRPDQNPLIKRVWGNRFPALRPGQILLEGAFTPTAFRGKRIMPRGMAVISEVATTANDREAITFVAPDNIPSLKGCIRAGYRPYCRKTVKCRFFREFASYEPIPESTPIPGVTDGEPVAPASSVAAPVAAR